MCGHLLRAKKVEFIKLEQHKAGQNIGSGMSVNEHVKACNKDYITMAESPSEQHMHHS
jgi:hypothetical protein